MIQKCWTHLEKLLFLPYYKSKILQIDEYYPNPTNKQDISVHILEKFFLLSPQNEKQRQFQEAKCSISAPNYPLG